MPPSRLHYFTGILGLLGLMALPLRAAPTVEERLAALEDKLAALSAENSSLREKLAAKPGALPVTIAGKETKLALGGFLHLNAESGDAPDSRYAGIHERFLVRRARLNLKGSFGSDWSFKLESDFGANTTGTTSAYRAQLTDVYVDWTPNPAAQVRVGQFKTPFGWEQLMPDTQNPFAERPLANDRLTLSRQIGAALSGTLAGGRADYSVGAFNGNGVNNAGNDNNAFLTVARVSAKAWTGKIHEQAATWSVGANAFTTRDTGTFTGRREGFGLDTQFNAGPAILRAEWLTSTSDPAAAAATEADGWYLTALYDLTKTWQFAARYETYDANTATARNETDTLVLGVNHRIRGNDLVLTLNYLAGNADLGGNDDRLIARLQVVF
ncbi:porin [Lacunisphaera limnophila]|nr:porin [Lacunisphaera limnophila]